MKKKDREFLKNILIRRRGDLLCQASGAVSILKTPQEKLADLTDRASFEAETEFMLRMRGREQKLIQKIDDALQRLETGTYEICEQCGGKISIERLKVRPVTTLCIDCKTAQEAFEKAAGL